MGKVATKICVDCDKCFPFLKLKNQPIEYLEIAETPVNVPKDQREFTEEPQNNSFTHTFSIDPTEFLLHYTDPLDLKCDKMIDKEGIQIYGNTFEEGFLLKAVWGSKFSPKQIVRFLRDNDQRKNWDKNIEKIESFNGNSPEEFYTYMKYKKVIAISQRDSVILSNVIAQPDGILLISRSVSHESYPVNPDITRMNIYLAGYYLKALNEGDCQTKVFNLTKINFGGSISHKFIQKTTAMAFPKMFELLEKSMAEYYNSRTQKIEDSI